MSRLADVQQLFWRSVRVQVPPPEVDAAFASRGRLSARDRLAIYRTAHWVRLVEALRELFPSVVEALGDGPFARLGSHYLTAHPPSHPYLEGIGERFPTFVASREPALEERAALDWARTCVFIAPDVATVTAASVDPAALPAAVLRVGPHVRVCGQHAVWRQGFAVHEERLEPGEATALSAARAPLPFTEWCELMGVPAEALVGRLHRWLGRGWLVSLS